MMVKSVNAKINQIGGLLGTKDINDWESEFIYSVIQKTNNGSDVSKLTDKQLDIIEKIHSKHYA